MPFEINNGSGGLIRATTIFTDTNHDLTNLNGTMLVAKLNKTHLGIFVSGVMRQEYTQIDGKDPHAETNLIKAIKDTQADLPFSTSVQNILSIKLSKSPCSQCTDALIAFKNGLCADMDVAIRIKIMELYHSESERTRGWQYRKAPETGHYLHSLAPGRPIRVERGRRRLRQQESCVEDRRRPRAHRADIDEARV